MNRVIARALLEDAYCQVMDNKVFRLLVILCIVLIAPWYLIGIRADGIHLLYGWKTISYEELFAAFGATVPKGIEIHIELIQGLQSFLVQTLAGSFGILFCIAATAFFVPRMLEKGAADTLFTKPIQRFALLASRYVAGLIFVGVLSFVLVLGIHVGLLLFSGYSDPGFLWSALTLVYVYALVQTVSVVVAVFTRSSVAAILCTILFFGFNGCVHQFWTLQEWKGERQSSTDADAPSAALQARVKDNALVRVLGATLDGLHYSLPKTHDADVLTKKLRTVVAGREYVLRDEAVKFVVEADPEGFKRTSEGGSVDLTQSPANWVQGESEITLSRRSRTKEGEGSSRRSRQSTSQAASELVKSLAGAPTVQGEPKRESPDSLQLLSEIVTWTETGPNGPIARQHAFIGVEDWMIELDARQPSSQDLRSMATVRRFMRGMRVLQDNVRFLGTAEWYENRFGWTSPLRFNAFFSLLSSIAFAALMLLISSWRLSRIDF
jgi:hypothetical protein